MVSRRSRATRAAVHDRAPRSRASPTAGKSGTAELGGTGEPHSWFIGFAPADESDRSRSRCIVEQGGRGGEVAAPIAGDLMTLYFEREQVTDEPVRAERPEPSDPAHGTAAPSTTRRAPRPCIERIGLAAIALVLAALFGGVAASRRGSAASCSWRRWARSAAS